jgi:epoxide hydrolase-like predicted phosphatase
MIYKAVIFDAGGVLHPDMSGAIKADVKKELGLSPDQAVDFWEMVMSTLGLGLITEAEFWSQVETRFGTRPVSAQENLLGRAYEKQLKLRSPVIGLAKLLAARGIKIAILSDTIESHVKAQAALGQFEHFDEVFLSNELHIRKPGPKIYEIALAKLGVKPEETIFIDDREVNLESPRQLGMRSVLYQNEDRLIAEIEALCLPVHEDLPWVCFTVLKRPDGALVLQHRDNKPNIASPGGITGWGGAGTDGETPLECAYRELREETNLRPEPNDFKFLGYFRKTKPVHGEDSHVWAFELDGIDDKTLKIFEGQGFVVLKNLRQASALPLTTLMRQVASELWADVKSRHE